MVRVEDRASLLRRSADDTDPIERVVVANADQLCIVLALADPEPRPRMVDRCLVAAYDAGMDALLVLTKADLREPDEFVAGYAPLDVAFVGDPAGPGRGGRGTGRRPVGARRAGQRAPRALRGRQVDARQRARAGRHPSVGVVNDVTGRGRHTSTSALALRLPGGGWVVDTPGVRSFGLAHVDPDRIIGALPRPGVGHRRLPARLHPRRGGVRPGRLRRVRRGRPGRGVPLESLRRLLRSRAGSPDDPKDGDGEEG